MKFSRLKKLTGLFFALVLGTSVAFSQGKQNRYMGNNHVQERFNINQLNDLSEQQKQFDLLALKKDLLFAGKPRMNKGLGNRQGWRNNITRQCYCINGNRCPGCQGRCINGFGKTQ